MSHRRLKIRNSIAFIYIHINKVSSQIKNVKFNSASTQVSFFRSSIEVVASYTNCHGGTLTVGGG